MKIAQLHYHYSAIFSRLIPASMMPFAEQTLRRYNYVYGGGPSYRADQQLPRSQSVYWRLVRAAEREKYFRARASWFVARGLARNSRFMLKWYFFALMAWIGLSHSLPLSLNYVGQLLMSVL